MGFHGCVMGGCSEQDSVFSRTSSGDTTLYIDYDGERYKFTLPDMFFHYAYDHRFDFLRFTTLFYRAVMEGEFEGGYRMQTKSLGLSSPRIPIEVGYLESGHPPSVLLSPDMDFINRVAGMVLAVESNEVYRANIFGEHGLSVLDPTFFECL